MNFRLNRTESRDFSIPKGQTTLKILIVNESRRTAYKIRSCIVLKDAFAKKLFCERTSQLYFFYMFVYIQCRRRRPTFQPLFLLSFFSLTLFPSSTDEQRACLKKFVKEDLTQFFKLNQLLNRFQACILYFAFIVPHRKIS